MEERVEFTMSDVIPEELLAGLSDTDREMESVTMVLSTTTHRFMT